MLPTAGGSEQGKPRPVNHGPNLRKFEAYATSRRPTRKKAPPQHAHYKSENKPRQERRCMTLSDEAYGKAATVMCLLPKQEAKPLAQAFSSKKRCFCSAGCRPRPTAEAVAPAAGSRQADIEFPAWRASPAAREEAVQTPKRCSSGGSGRHPAITRAARDVATRTAALL